MFKLIAFVALTFSMSLACAKKDKGEEQRSEQVEPVPSEGILAKRRDQLIHAAQKRMAAMEKKIDALKDTARLQEGLAALRERLRVLRQSLEEAKNQVLDTWDKYETDIVELLDALEQEYDRVVD